MSNSLKNLSKALLALTVVSGMTSTPLLAPPKPEDIIDIDKDGKQPEAQTATATPQKTTSNNPFANVDYFAENLEVRIPFGKTVFTVNCGKGGSGSILEPLEEISFVKSTELKSDLTARFNKDKKERETAFWASTTSLFLNKDDSSLKDIIETIQIMITQHEQTLGNLPAGLNLALRALVLFNANLPMNEMILEMTTLAARYKLSLCTEKPKNDTVINRMIENIMNMFKNKEDKTKPSGSTKKTPIEKLFDFLKKEKEEITLSPEDAALLGETTPGYVGKDLTPAGKEFLDNLEKDKEITTKDKDALIGRVKAGKLTPHDIKLLTITKDTKTKLAERGLIAGKLVAIAINNAHNAMAKEHEKLMAGSAYRAAFETEKINKCKQLKFLSSTIGSAANKRIQEKIEAIKKNLPMPTEDATDLGTAKLKQGLKQREELLAFYREELTNAQAAMKPKPQAASQEGKPAEDRPATLREKLAAAKKGPVISDSSTVQPLYAYYVELLEKSIATLTADNKDIQEYVEASQDISDPSDEELTILQPYYNKIERAIDNMLPSAIANSSRSLFSIGSELKKPDFKGINDTFKKEFKTAMEKAGFDKGKGKEQKDILEAGLKLYLPEIFKAFEAEPTATPEADDYN